MEPSSGKPIEKKILHGGIGDLPQFPDGTKVRLRAHFPDFKRQEIFCIFILNNLKSRSVFTTLPN